MLGIFVNYIWNVPLGFVLSEKITDSAYNEFSPNNMSSTCKGQNDGLSDAASSFRVTFWILLGRYKSKTNVE